MFRFGANAPVRPHTRNPGIDRAERGRSEDTNTRPFSRVATLTGGTRVSVSSALQELVQVIIIARSPHRVPAVVATALMTSVQPPAKSAALFHRMALIVSCRQASSSGGAERDIDAEERPNRALRCALNRTGSRVAHSAPIYRSGTGDIWSSGGTSRCHLRGGTSIHQLLE